MTYDSKLHWTFNTPLTKVKHEISMKSKIFQLFVAVLYEKFNKLQDKLYIQYKELFQNVVFLKFLSLDNHDHLCVGNTYHQALLTKPMELNVNFHL